MRLFEKDFVGEERILLQTQFSSFANSAFCFSALFVRIGSFVPHMIIMRCSTFFHYILQLSILLSVAQLYRAAAPTTQDILRLMSPTANTGVPAKIYENRDVDESGVDGVGLLYTQTGSVSETSSTSNNRGNGGFFGNAVTLPTLAKDDMSVFVQPSQESVDVIEELSMSAGSSLIALLNPQWRNVDDALDVASKENNLFGQFASFLGGKGSSLRRLDELEFRSSFTLEGYVCKGGNIRLIKRFDSDWVVFAENDSGDEYVRVGTSVERPMYQDVDKMLDEAGVGYKYARDLGLAPKL